MTGQSRPPAPPRDAAEYRARLKAAAERALAEAAARRQAEKQARKNLMTPQPREIGGPKGPEPTRFGDWERKGLASDF